MNHDRPRGFRRRLMLAGLLTLGAAATAPAQLVPPPADPPAKAGGAGAKKDAPKASANGNGDADKAGQTAPAEPARPPLTLGECLNLAHSRRPALAAAQHSLAAAERGAAALSGLGRVAEFVSPDLPVRRQQAARGVATAEAEVRRVRAEITQDVTYTYYSYVYARQAEKSATDVISQLETYYDVAKAIVESNVRDAKLKVDQFTLYRLQNSIGDVRQLQQKARAGKRTALEALRQAMGAPPDYEFAPYASELPLMLGGGVTREQVVNGALANRPELAQAAAGVDAFRLEVQAQGLVKRKLQVPTLAAGGDIHSRQVPNAVRDGTYSPGGIPPEMPAGLAGKVGDRVARACELSQRQDALYDETVSLIRLEAERAFINWEVATRRVIEAERRSATASRLVEESRPAAIARQDADLLVQSEQLAGKALADYLDAVYEHLKAIAALERVSGGAVTAQFPDR